MSNYLMQAASSVDGRLYTWSRDTADYGGDDYPGDGTATDAVVLSAPIEVPDTLVEKTLSAPTVRETVTTLSSGGSGRATLVSRFDEFGSSDTDPQRILYWGLANNSKVRIDVAIECFCSGAPTKRGSYQRRILAAKEGSTLVVDDVTGDDGDFDQTGGSISVTDDDFGVEVYFTAADADPRTISIEVIVRTIVVGE